MTQRTEEVRWRRATRCSSGTCAEVAKVGDRYLMRNSTTPDVVVSLDEAEWAAFTAGVKADEFNW